MEVKLDKRYPVQASVAQSWAVLSDVRAVAACMPGANITEQLDDTHYKGTVKSKVGPATMSFNGDIEILGLNVEERSMSMLGKGADKSGSSASMKLDAKVEPGETEGSSVLVGVATILVSGKLAQFGSRLLVPVSDAMLAQFANRFNDAAAAVPAGGVESVPVAPVDELSLAPLVPAGGTAETPIASTIERAGALVTPSSAPAAPGDFAPDKTVPVPPPPPAAKLPPPPPPRPIAPAPANELNALSLLWAVIKGWFAGLFGRR